MLLVVGRRGCGPWEKMSIVMRRGKKQRLERISKNNEMWDALRIKEKEEEERKKKEREEKRKNSGIS